MQNAAIVLFLRTSAEERCEVDHHDHKMRSDCVMYRLAFLEEVWSIVPRYGTPVLKKGPIIQLEKLFTRYALAPFEQADVIVIYERFENKAAGELIILNLLMEEIDDNSKDLRDQDRLCAKKLRILMSQ